MARLWFSIRAGKLLKILENRAPVEHYTVTAFNPWEYFAGDLIITAFSLHNFAVKLNFFK